VESDSEEEVDPEDIGTGQGSSGASTSRIARVDPQVELRGKIAKVDRLVIALDQAGQDWAEGFAPDTLEESAELFVNEKKVLTLLLAPRRSLTRSSFLGRKHKLRPRHSYRLHCSFTKL
jgi:hypothetical protein